METIGFLQSFASPALDVFAQAISDLGSERGYIALLLIAYLGWDAKIGQRAGVYLLLAFTLNYHLKDLFATSRPFVFDADVYRSSEENLGPGFPSGHAQGATAFWGYLAVRAQKLWFWVLAASIVVLISWSRVYLGLHFPIDVIGGILIGAGVVAAARGIDRASRRVSIPWWAAVGAGVVLPLLVNVLVPPPGDESGLLMGGLAAFLTAPLFWQHRVPAAWWRRLGMVLLGLVIAFTLLTVSSLVMPEDVKRHGVGGFLRYFLLGYAGLWLAPWLGEKLGLGARAGAG